MIARGQPVLQSDLAALATLANSKLTPPVAYAFNGFVGDKTIALPSQITAVQIPGTLFEISKVTLRLYAYKLIGGVRSYTYIPTLKAYYNSDGSFVTGAKFTWTNPVLLPPDGYIASIVLGPQSNGWGYFWKDIGSVQTLTITNETFTGWFQDNSLLSMAILEAGNPAFQDMPCGHGIWLKQLNAVRQDVLGHTDILCANVGSIAALPNVAPTAPFPSTGYGSVIAKGLSGLISGPWCVGVGPQLQCSISKTVIYGNGLTTQLSQLQAQLYAGVRFYFRNADAEAGINITAQNQLLNFEQGSNPTTATTATWPLMLLNCGTGHIKVQQSGGGTVYHDIDVVAGNTYDLSIITTGVFTVGSIVPLNLDFTFTIAATIMSVVGVGIELNNDIQVATVPDAYFEVQFNLVLRNNLNAITGTTVCTSCGVCILTENNNTPGVWVAKAPPTQGLMTFLDQDLPQYLINNPANESSRNIPLNEVLPFIPAVDNRGALWPVFRDSDFIPDSVFGHALDGSVAWRNSIATKSITFLSDNTTVVQPSLVLLTQWNFGSQYVQPNAQEVRILCSNPALSVYLKIGSPPSLASYDAIIPGGTWLIATSAQGYWQTNANWYIGFYNNTSAQITPTFYFGQNLDKASPNGTFFPTDGNFPTPLPSFESKSYSVRDPNNEPFPGGGNYPVPLYGYAVYSLTVRRQPQDNGSGVAVAPSIGTAALSVNIGIMKGFGFDAQGTFTNLMTVTIPAGQASVVVPVFWPVLSGTPLAYQCSQPVAIRASVCFQPMMHSQFSTASDVQHGTFSGAPWYGPVNSAWPMNQALYFPEGGTITELGFLLPLTEEIVNDLTTVLNLM